jgi:hypothetical protein
MRKKVKTDGSRLSNQRCERWPFGWQKATFQRVKGHVLQDKRRHIDNSLIINKLHERRKTGRKSWPNTLQ